MYWLIASKAQTRACCHHLENNFSISRQWLTKPVTQLFIHLFIHCSFILCTYISHGPTMYQRGGDGGGGGPEGRPVWGSAENMWPCLRRGHKKERSGAVDRQDGQRAPVETRTCRHLGKASSSRGQNPQRQPTTHRQWELQSVRRLFVRRGGQRLEAVLLLVLACPAPRTTWLPASMQLPMTVTRALSHCLCWLCWDTGPLSQCGSAPLQVQAVANTNHVWASTPASRCFPWIARLLSLHHKLRPENC